MQLQSNITVQGKTGLILPQDSMRLWSTVWRMEHGATSSTLRPAKVRRSPAQIISFSPEMFCPEQPPPAPEGEGSERVFGMEVTKYRCKNGFQWSNGKWPYLEMECLNKKWAPKTLPECVREYQSNLCFETFLSLQPEAAAWPSPLLWWGWT